MDLHEIMNTTRSYITHAHLSSRVQLTNEELTQRVETLTDMLQGILNYLSERDKKNLGFIANGAPIGIEFKVVESEEIKND